MFTKLSSSALTVHQLVDHNVDIGERVYKIEQR